MVALALAGCGRIAADNATAETSPPIVDSAVADIADVQVEDVWSLPSDGAPPPFEGNWSNVLGLPECPNIWLSRTPQTDVADEWTPCSGPRPGCFRMSTPWAPSSANRVTSEDRMDRRPGLDELFEYARTFPLELMPRRTVSIVQSPVTIPRLALAQLISGECGAGLTMAPSHAVLAVGIRGRPAAMRLVTVPYADPAVPVDAFEVRDEDVTTGGGHVNRLAVGDRRVFLGTSGTGPHSIAVVDRATHLVIKKVGPDSAPVESPMPVPGGAISAWHQWPYGIAFIDENGTVEKLHTVRDELLLAVRVDPATGTVVWVTDLNSGGADSARFTIWAAPAVRRAADFRPRALAKFSSAAWTALEGAFVANEGYVLTKQDELRALLVRLSDGARWTVAPEAEDRWSWTAFVTRKEIGMIVGDRAHLGVLVRDMRTIVRLSIDGLGPSAP